ncbi:MAG: hypothetical protein AAFP76_15070 [Bacteroidota bacterium]
MKFLSSYFAILLVFVLLACKDSKPKENRLSPQVPVEVEDPLDAIEVEQQKALENAYFYVMAPSGLALRTSDRPNSEKITTLPFGSKVKQVSPVFTIDYTIENIGGSMMEVNYKDTIGYAYSGFLSPYPMPVKGEETNIYVQRLQKVNPEVSFNEKRTDPEFHEGIVQTLRLPNVEWHEAFYLAKAQFNVPKSLNFPGHEGDARQVISQQDKAEYVWSSDLVAMRTSGRLDTLQYNWRAEGGGYWITITEPRSGVMTIEYIAFAD